MIFEKFSDQGLAADLNQEDLTPAFNDQNGLGTDNYAEKKERILFSKISSPVLIKSRKTNNFKANEIVRIFKVKFLIIEFNQFLTLMFGF